MLNGAKLRLNIIYNIYLTFLLFDTAARWIYIECVFISSHSGLKPSMLSRTFQIWPLIRRLCLNHCWKPPWRFYLRVILFCITIATFILFRLILRLLILNIETTFIKLVAEIKGLTDGMGCYIQLAHPPSLRIKRIIKWLIQILYRLNIHAKLALIHQRLSVILKHRFTPCMSNRRLCQSITFTHLFFSFLSQSLVSLGGHGDTFILNTLQLFGILERLHF